MKLLDLYCCQGGAAMGYHRAGFEVTGVDIDPQPRFPFEFHQADALEFLAEHGHEYDAIHASPPCQAYSSLRTMQTHKKRVDLVGLTREALRATGKPWVIENVVGAPLRHPVMLCGTMFDLTVTTEAEGLMALRRHRLFETSGWALWPPRLCDHTLPTAGVYGNGGGGRMRGYKVVRAEASELMDIDWMIQKGLSQAIPPAYTQHVAKFLFHEIERLAA